MIEYLNQSFITPHTLFAGAGIYSFESFARRESRGGAAAGKMEGDLPEGGHGGGNGDDAEVMAGLSTVLVATIQEVKDRISHIEFIFCSQLFPRFRSRSRTLQKQISVEEDWRRKEASLLRQIEEFRLQKEKAEEETRRMAVSLEREKAEKADMARILAKLESAERTSETVIAGVREECRHAQEEMQRQIDLKDLELSEETFRRKQLAKSWAKLEERYKHLKSQYRFLLRKAGLVAETSDGTGGERGSPMSLPHKPKAPLGKLLLISSSPPKVRFLFRFS